MFVADWTFPPKGFSLFHDSLAAATWDITVAATWDFLLSAPNLNLVLEVVSEIYHDEGIEDVQLIVVVRAKVGAVEVGDGVVLATIEVVAAS